MLKRIKGVSRKLPSSHGRISFILVFFVACFMGGPAWGQSVYEAKLIA